MYLLLFVLSKVVSANSIKDIPHSRSSAHPLIHPFLTLSPPSTASWSCLIGSVSINLWFKSQGFCWLRILLKLIQPLTWLSFFNPCRISSSVMYWRCYAQRFRLLKSGKECTPSSYILIVSLMVAGVRLHVIICAVAVCSFSKLRSSHEDLVRLQTDFAVCWKRV